MSAPTHEAIVIQATAIVGPRRSGRQAARRKRPSSPASAAGPCKHASPEPGPSKLSKLPVEALTDACPVAAFAETFPAAAPLVHVAARGYTKLAAAVTWARRPLRLYHLHEIPEYLADNEYILTRHRAHYSHAECLRSALPCHAHNETANIYTHLVGAILFAAFARHAIYVDVVERGTLSDRLVMAVYHASACICLALSTVFHTFHCHSDRKVFDVVAIMDYTGIACLLGGSFTALSYFAFRPHPTLLPFPLGVTFAASLAGVVLPWMPIFRTHRFRTLRTAIFAFLGGSILVTTAWAAFAIRVELAREFQLAWLALAVGTLACYCGGAVIYATRVPERWAPGLFDVWFHSHQIWHVLVFLGALMHWYLLAALRDWRLAGDLTLFSS